MASFRNKDLAELAHQLSLSPKSQRLQQVRGIESMLAMTDSEKAYPYDFVCHQITGYRIRQPDPKRCSVRAFRSLEYKILAAGDSYNDVSMLEEADAGFFFNAPDNVRADYPQYAAAEDYEGLQSLLATADESFRA